jgi:hypothetical protein
MMTKRKLLFSLVFLLEALLIAFALTQRSPPSGDDYSYLYQAKLLASGKMYAEDPLYDQADPLHDCIKTNCITDNGGRRFSKYPPGWPVILALGAVLGVPWLVDPILGAILVFLILRYVERQMGENMVNVAGLLLTLCLFLGYYGASLRSHGDRAIRVWRLHRLRRGKAISCVFAIVAFHGRSASWLFVPDPLHRLGSPGCLGRS